MAVREPGNLESPANKVEEIHSESGRASLEPSSSYVPLCALPLTIKLTCKRWMGWRTWRAVRAAVAAIRAMQDKPAEIA
jgi:hypothetical protein